MTVVLTAKDILHIAATVGLVILGLVGVCLEELGHK